MPNAAAVQIAQAVTDKLNGPVGVWSRAFTATRLYHVKAELKDDGLHVNVAIREASVEIVSRAETEESVAVDIGVRQKGAVTNAEIDSLMGLLEEFKDAFLAKRLPTADAGEAWCYAAERNPFYWPGHLQDLRQLTAVLTLRFRIAGSLAP